jgi:DNA mismatch repair protein PMS2
MATIKAIEAKSVHQIQSGQVIVDLCSVAKELVENSLDAGATSIEVRFKNNGLDLIEVQDNGSGISPANYDNVALKHFTSKLSNYDDLSNLQTFGFRGEALSSLCALSKFYMTTALSDEAPKGKRLEFDTLGRLTSTNIVACQKGTTVTVEGLFESLPVRRKELTKNIKREYGKVLGLLQAYACICVNVKFTVKNTMPKAKSMTVFSTKANASTRENIANVYGAKTLAALIPIDLNLHFQPTLTQLGRKDKSNPEIHVRGHISKPVFGEGRQTPDRQMFFVNGRPCGLPQIAKAINEVYKSFNVSQSPFIFADFQMDTNAYDVNVSPDKRTILLHDAAVLVENLKTALNDMFEQQDQTIPQSQLQTPRLPAFQKLNFHSRPPSDSPESESRQGSVRERSLLHDDDSINHGTESGDGDGPASLLREHFRNFTSTRHESEVHGKMQGSVRKDQERRAEKVARKIAEQEAKFGERDKYDDIRENQETTPTQETQQSQDDPVKIHVRDSNERMAEQGSRSADNSHSASPSDVEMGSGSRSLSQQASKEEKGVVPNAFDRMRPKRVPAEFATVTIGDKTITTVIGSQLPRFPETKGKRNGQGGETPSAAQRTKSAAAFQFSQKLRNFGAQSAPDEEGDFEIRTQQTDSAEDESEEVEDLRASDQEAPTKQIDVDEDEIEKDVGTPKEDLNNGSDSDYVDEEEKRKIEEARVAELIRIAEESSALPSKENLKRATKALSGGRIKDSTTSLLTAIDFSMESVTLDMRQLTDTGMATETLRAEQDYTPVAQDPEAQLSLTVSKGDFANMGIVGQFNLGFILAVRAASEGGNGMSKSKRDELFIVDQHASDEKYNFERLQAETVVGNQRLVQPVTLDLTAVEEEIVLENNDTLEKNGFVVEIDTSGESVVGRRCRLVSLPLSKEVVFNTRDLEELIQLLAEAPGLGTQSRHGIPRPGKVRKMFAMRACRSSIMIGKTLSRKQMEKVVSHMGTIDKPWNCPHGRPTMRHLCSLNTLEPWMEGDAGDGDVALSLGEALQRYATE